MTTVRFNNQRFAHITLSRLGAGALAGFISGAMAGAISRISMRAIALALEMTPDLSYDGTFFIILFGAFFGVIPGLLYIVFESFLPSSTALKGVLWGIVILGLTSLPLLFLEPEGELSLLPPLFIVIAFIPVYMIFGLELAFFTAWLARRAARLAV
jgi:hypothetical protein